MSEYAAKEKKAQIPFKARKVNHTVPKILEKQVNQPSEFFLSDAAGDYINKASSVSSLVSTRGNKEFPGSRQDNASPIKKGNVIQRILEAAGPALDRNCHMNGDHLTLIEKKEGTETSVESDGKQLIEKKAMSDTMQLTTIKLNEERQEIEDLPKKIETKNGISRAREGLPFGNYIEIQNKFRGEIRPMNYIRKSDIASQNSDSSEIENSIGNLWEGNNQYNSVIHTYPNIPIQHRSQYQCAEPHAFSMALSEYGSNRETFYNRKIEAVQNSIQAVQNSIQEKEEVAQRIQELDSKIEDKWDEVAEAQITENTEEEEKSMIEIEDMEGEKNNILKKMSQLSKESMPALISKLTEAETRIAEVRNKKENDAENKTQLNEFISRLKFEPAQNREREGDDKTEPTCPVCKQWVKDDLKINIRV